MTKDKVHQLATCLGAWILMGATLVSSAEIIREPVAVLATEDPAVHSGINFSELARKENESETVHMPTKYDVGLRMNSIAGRK